MFLEYIFILMYYMGFTYSEAYRLPVWQRKWFVERLQQEFKRGQENEQHITRASQPEERALAGLRPEAPARVKRFT